MKNSVYSIIDNYQYWMCRDRLEILLKYLTKLSKKDESILDDLEKFINEKNKEINGDD